MKSVSVWAFHGDSDDVVYTEESIKMTEAVLKTGGEVKLTIYKDCGHNAWDKTYSNPEVFKWLLGKNCHIINFGSDNFDNPQIYG